MSTLLAIIFTGIGIFVLIRIIILKVKPTAYIDWESHTSIISALVMVLLIVGIFIHLLIFLSNDTRLDYMKEAQYSQCISLKKSPAECRKIVNAK